MNNKCCHDSFTIFKFWTLQSCLIQLQFLSLVSATLKRTHYTSPTQTYFILSCYTSHTEQLLHTHIRAPHCPLVDLPAVEKGVGWSKSCHSPMRGNTLPRPSPHQPSGSHVSLYLQGANTATLSSPRNCSFGFIVNTLLFVQLRYLLSLHTKIITDTPTFPAWVWASWQSHPFRSCSYVQLYVLCACPVITLVPPSWFHPSPPHSTPTSQIPNSDL